MFSSFLLFYLCSFADIYFTCSVWMFILAFCTRFWHFLYEMSNTPPPPYPGPMDHTKIPFDAEKQQQHGTAVYPPPPNFGTSIVHAPMPPPIIVRAVHARTAPFGPLPVEMDCPYCRSHIVTHIQQVPGALPWIIMAVCFVLGFFLLIPWCLCCLPFCIDSCLDVLHTCPSCKRLVGRFSRL